MENYVITISRRFASNGHAIAARAGEILGIPVYDRGFVEARWRQDAGRDTPPETLSKSGNISGSDRSETGRGILKAFFRRDIREEEDDRAQAEFERQSSIIRTLAQEGSCIIIGRCADVVLKDYQRALHVFIYAAMDERLKTAMQMLHTGEAEARTMIDNEDRSREAYRRRFSGYGADDIQGRHILLDSGRLGVEESARILVSASKALFYDMQTEENDL